MANGQEYQGCSFWFACRVAPRSVSRSGKLISVDQFFKDAAWVLRDFNAREIERGHLEQVQIRGRMFWRTPDAE